MSNENNDNKDFISMLKDMKVNNNAPSVIGETLEKIESLEEENKKLKEKLENSTQFEEDLKKVIEEKNIINDDLKEKEDQLSSLLSKFRFLDSQIADLTKENESFRSKIEELEAAKQAQEEASKQAQEEAAKQAQEEASKQAQEEASKQAQEEAAKQAQEDSTKQAQEESLTTLPPVPTIDVSANKTLIDDLTSELSKKKGQILSLKNDIKTVTEENESLKEQIEKKPSVSSSPPTKGPSKPLEPTQTGSSTLEILCQDLQSALNKYKKIVVNLKEENKTLKNAQQSGAPAESDKIMGLKRENDALKTKISNLEQSIESKAKNSASENVADNKNAADSKIKELENKLKGKEKLIEELKASKPTEAKAQVSGAVSGLVEDLQNKINKLKTALKEKNKVIEDLKEKSKLTFIK